MNSEDTTQIPPPAPRRITRSREDRLIAGVCGGLGRYFDVDPVLFRVAAVALIFLGGAGVLLYLAAILLIPNEGEEGAAVRTRRERVLAIVGVILLVVAAGVIFSHGPFHFGWVFGPLAFFAIAGFVIWWLVSGERPSGDGRNLALSLARGLGVLAICIALAIAGAWIAGAGGGTAAAIAVIVAGAALAGAALEGRGRWLILPALSLALPVAFVSAANIDLRGGTGDRQFVPSSASQVRDTYRLGAGRLIVDLRHADLPPGDRTINVKLGAGEAVVIVPKDVCVATKAKIGIGVVDAFNRTNGGVDVDWQNQPTARASNARVVLDAHLGVGRLAVAHSFKDTFRDRRYHFRDADLSPEPNTGCDVAG